MAGSGETAWYHPCAALLHRDVQGSVAHTPLPWVSLLGNGTISGMPGRPLSVSKLPQWESQMGFVLLKCK